MRSNVLKIHYVTGFLVIIAMLEPPFSVNITALKRSIVVASDCIYLQTLMSVTNS